jgi:hypothetical protein
VLYIEFRVLYIEFRVLYIEFRVLYIEFRVLCIESHGISLLTSNFWFTSITAGKSRIVGHT